MSDDLKVGHSRFDSYGLNTKLEIVGEPVKKKFSDKTAPEIIKLEDYNPFSDKKRDDQPKVEVAQETLVVEIPKRTPEDEVIVEVECNGKKYSVPRWMVKYVSGCF